MPHVLSTMRCEKTKSDDSDSRYASNASFPTECRIEQCASESTSDHTLGGKWRKPLLLGSPEKKTSSFFSGPSK